MRIFTYGTLMVPTVMRAVTGRNFTAQAACLRNYARFRVKDALYPGIVAKRHGMIDGIVYLGLDHSAVKRLDVFEGGLYRRIQVRVEIKSGEFISAETYVVKPSFHYRLTSSTWSHEEFECKHLDEFLNVYPGIRKVRSG